MEQFIASFKAAPDELVLDFDATDNPLHDQQEGRFSHGYYDSYRYLPLYVLCGHDEARVDLRVQGDAALVSGLLRRNGLAPLRRDLGNGNVVQRQLLT